jgi:hypothetical protein
MTCTAQRDGVHYHVEALPGGRGRLRADVVLDGRLDHSYGIGSAAPLATALTAAALLNRYPDPGAAERT